MCVSVCVKLYLDKSPRLQEGQAIFGFVDELLYLFAQFGQLLSDFKVGDNALLIRDLNGMVLLLQLLYFCTEKKTCNVMKTQQRMEFYFSILQKNTLAFYTSSFQLVN